MSATLTAAADAPNVFQQVIDAGIPIGQYKLHWLELLGVLIGIASAWYGMKRRVWAWPVGIVANVMLFFVYTAAAFGADSRVPLFGQAGRQVFFILTSIYGWYRWAQFQRATGDPSAPAVTPHWMTNRQRLVVVLAWVLGTVVVQAVFAQISSFPAAWWYYWCDAWIFVGSIAATYAMARGWNEFWLAWIGVDLVGVPLGFATGYVPTSVLYIFYGGFVVYGFVQWVKISRAERPRALSDPAVEAVA
jgi:nicotinamide mononucleotide transporter